MKITLFMFIAIFLIVVVGSTYFYAPPTLPTAEGFVTAEEYDKAYSYLSARYATFDTATKDYQNQQIDKFVKENPLFFQAGSSDSSNPTLSESQRQRNVAGAGLDACPTSAYYDKRGVIHVDPGNLTFDTLAQYQKYMQNLINQKSYSNCKVIEVQSMSGALSSEMGSGVFGGSQQPSEYDLQRQAMDRSTIETTMTKGGVSMVNEVGEQMFAETPIEKLDDYEFSRVFELENAPRNARLSQEAKSDLMSRYKLDWANLPWNSDEKAKEEDTFISGRQEDGFRDPKTGVFFRNMEGEDVAPPDEAAISEREAKIMTGYKPTDLSKHVVDSEMERVAQVVNQAYGNDPEWEPIVEKVGEHQYSVTELRPREKKEEWESDTPTVQQAKDQGILTGTSFAPDMKIDGGRSDDPYFDKAGVVDYANDRVWKYQDFNKWTPGLERMFAPTNDTKVWY